MAATATEAAVAAALKGGASSGMRIVAGTSCSAAARASACAWLPEEAASTPRSRSAFGSEATAL